VRSSASALLRPRPEDPEGVAEPALPAKLVELTLEADRVLTF
jgi:hypothetical protein